MNTNITDIINEWSYRLSLIEDHEGYPNLKSYNDLDLLESVLIDYNWHWEERSEFLHNIKHPKQTLHEVNIKDIRDLIVKKLGSKLGLGVMGTAKNLANIKNTNPDIIAKEVGKALSTKVMVVPPGDKDLNGKKISNSLHGLSFEYDGVIRSLKLSKGSGGKAGVPGDAAYYEMGICVEYNKSKGMDRDKAINAAGVDISKYETYEEHVGEIGEKIVKKLGNVGPMLVYTGALKGKSPTNPFADNTPKTDILGDKKHRISLKKKGGSQLGSGTGPEAKGMFVAGKAFYEEHNNKEAGAVIDDCIDKVESDFKKINTDNTAGDVRRGFSDWYVQKRVPEIKSELKTEHSDGDIVKHAKAEAMAAGVWHRGKVKTFKNWFISGLKDKSKEIMTKYFPEYLKSMGTKELKDEAEQIIKQAITHENLQKIFDNAWKDKEFKKWCIYESASGNYKFSGTPKLESVEDEIANRLLVFGLDGNVNQKEGKEITPDWASKYASKVKMNVSYKTTGRSKSTAARLVVSGKENEKEISVFGKDFNEMLDIQTKLLHEEIDMLCEETNRELLTEGLLKKGSQYFQKFKSVVKKLAKKILDSIKKFFSEIFSKVIKKLKEYAKNGLTYFYDALGIDISGSATFNVGL